MLRTRLWMGAILVALSLGVLAVDQHLVLTVDQHHLTIAPFLLVMTLALSLVGVYELLNLLDDEKRPPAWLAYGGVAAVLIANWLPHVFPMLPAPLTSSPWGWVAGTFAAVVLSAFLREMSVFREPGHATVRIAFVTFFVAYLGLLPSFFVQLRWLNDPTRATLSLALAIFVPKFCDVGAYFAGRFLGKHKATPVLSPKKTWEGFAGGMAVSVATAVGIHLLGPVFPGDYALLSAIGFGLVVGLVGILGDLAESLIKRDCQKKDASTVMPGFGGVLDVVDSIIFAAPVVYFWLR
jgi:phosphatidate cytidylyltransferase